MNASKQSTKHTKRMYHLIHNVPLGTEVLFFPSEQKYVPNQRLGTR